jgi:hypothetical protein
MLSHIAMSVERSTFTDDYISDLEFYCDLLGWKVNENLSIKNERLLMSLPDHGQYLNVRALDEPMVSSSYEHMGIYVATSEEVHSLHSKVQLHGEKDNRVQLDERGVQNLYGGVLTTFRFKYLLPLAIEIQHLATDT